MRCIIAGSRSFHGQSVGIIQRAVDASGFGPEITEVVSGGAKGIDFLGEVWAKSKKLPVKRFPPDYDNEKPKRAPLVRNVQMASYAAERPNGAAIVIHDGVSKGSMHMAYVASEYGLRVFVGHPKEAAVGRS